MIDFLHSDEDDNFSDKDESKIALGQRIFHTCIDFMNSGNDQDTELSTEDHENTGIEDLYTKVFGSEIDRESEKFEVLTLDFFFHALSSDPEYPKTRTLGLEILCSLLANISRKMTFENEKARGELFARELSRNTSIDQEFAHEFSNAYLQRREGNQDEHLIELEAMTKDGLEALSPLLVTTIFLQDSLDSKDDDEISDIEEKYMKAYEKFYPHILEVSQGMILLIISLTQTCHKECEALGTLEENQTSFVQETLAQLREAYHFDDEDSDSHYRS